MLPVARIAQSVEQGIENPRVLGSIPSPGTIFRRTRLWRVFRFLGYGLSIELRSIIRPEASPCGPALKRCSTRRQRRLSESGRPIQKNPPMAGFSLSGIRTLHRTAFDYSVFRFLGGISPISASTQDLAASTRLRCPGKATLINQKARKIARETGQASTKNRVSHNRWAQNSSVSTIANTPKGRYRISLR